MLDLIDVIADEFATEPDIVLQLVNLIRKRKFGIVLVNSTSDPTSYWSDANIPAQIRNGLMHDPLCFASVRRAERVVHRQRQVGEKWYMSLWMHPDMDVIPLARHHRLQMFFEGNKQGGSA